MKKLITISLLASLSIGAEVTATNSNLVDNLFLSSKLWDMAKSQKVVVYPQTTLNLNDKRAKEILKETKAKEIEIKSLYSASKVAIKIKWSDLTENIYQADSTDGYADGVAIEFPLKFDNPKDLPYIGMGDSNREVIIYLTKAYEGVYEPKADVKYQVNPHNTVNFGDELTNFNREVKRLANPYSKEFIARGFKTTTEIKDSKSFEFTMNYSNGFWEAMLVRDISDEYLNLDVDMFPISVAIWDGESLNRDGIKRISKWTPITLKARDEKYVSTLNYQYSGNIENGKKLVGDNCFACHSYGDMDNQMPYMAPNLSNIGGYANASYLVESIKEPSRAVLLGYNRYGHKNTPWYSIEDGKEISAMPSYSYMSDSEIADIVTYLQSLKAEVEK